MKTGTKQPLSAQRRRHAQELAERLTKALHSAQFLQDELARLVIFAPEFAAILSDQADRAQAQVDFLRAALKRVEAAIGDE